MLQAGRSQVEVPMRSLNLFSNVPNPSSRTMTLGFIQPLTEMSTRRYFWGKALPARRADNLTAIWKPIFHTVWDPRRLTNL
jgi:hypothetical protein